MTLLFGLIVDLFKGWLGFKQDSAISEGKSEQRSVDLQASLDTAKVEAQAAVNAPMTKDALIQALKDHSASIILLLFLTSCVSSVSNSCPSLRPWTNAQEDTLAANLATLPPNSPLIAMGTDWALMRAQIKACNGG